MTGEPTGPDVIAFKNFMNSQPDAQRTPFVVGNTNDSGVLSLRDAIAQMNAISNASPDPLITFDPSLIGGTVNLVTPLPQISRTMQIVGLGANNLAISGNGLNQIFNVGGNNTPTVGMEGLTLKSGKAAGGGGALVSNGANVFLAGDTLNSNTANTGGGIFVGSGALTINNSVISGNTAGGPGGGLFAGNGATIIVNNSTFTSNFGTFGGGVYAQNNVVTIFNSTFSLNQATGGVGGGVDLDQGATGVITNSTFFGNNAAFGGGIVADNAAVLRVFSSTVVGNTSASGAAYVDTATGATGQFDGNIIYGNNGVNCGNCGSNGNNFIGGSANPLLGVLQNYGGPVDTIEPFPGSPVIGGYPANSYTPLFDQRGVSRIVLNGNATFGAVDLNSEFAVLQGPINQNLGTQESLELELRDDFSNPVIPNNLTLFGGGNLPAIVAGASLFSGGGLLTGNTSTVNPSTGRASFSLGFTTPGVKGVKITSPGVYPTLLPSFTIFGPPTVVSIGGGNNQIVPVNNAFIAGLSVTVGDVVGDRIADIITNWNVIPGTNGAGATFPGPPPFEGSAKLAGAPRDATGSTTSTTNAQGVATAPTLTANSIAGTYTVRASVAGVATPATFTLTNTAGPAASITATAGGGQSTATGNAFATAMSATVKDASNNPVSNATVTFTAPNSGASGTFPGSVLTANASTNAQGVATAPAFTANATAGGPYNVTAAVAGVASPANFALTNLANAVNVTLQTSPANLLVSFDGGAFAAAPVTRSLAIGSVHVIAAQSPQPGATGVQYVWQNWNDAGAISHNITVPGADASFTATFKTQYQLTISASPLAGGAVTPASGTFSDSGTVAPVTAAANNGFQFAGWTGNVASASSASTTVTMTGPQTVTANFTSPCQFTINPSAVTYAAVGGTGNISVTAPQGCTWTAISSAGWLTINSGAGGSGNGTVSYTAGQNLVNSQRTGTLSISGQTFTQFSTITQNASQIFDNTFFIRQLYLDLLNRQADAGGLNFWVPPLNSGALTRKDAGVSFFNSPEFQQTGFFVIGAYIAVLGRDPDFGGWQFWLTSLNNGAPRANIVNSFIVSQEFVQTYGSLTNQAFVQLVYQNVLGRAPDQGGLNFWVGQLNGGLTRADMMYQFIVSAEYAARIQNRALATLLYMGFLRRSPEPGGLAFWLNALNNGLPQADAISQFISSVEYLLRF